MDIAALDRAVADHAAGVLLRYFSSIGVVALDHPLVEIERDRELLRLHWSLSQPVSDLVAYVLEHRHEIQSALQTSLRHEDGIVRGRLDAVRTVRQRLVSGMPTAVVSHEPLRSYASGPNQVLGWVLMQAWSLATRFETITLDSPGYRAAIENALQRLEQARRIQAIGQITGQTILNRRPGAGAVLEAGRSRRALYRMATDAYKALLAVEAGNPEIITAMLRKTLLSPLEPWRRFELAVGLSAAEELALAEGQKLSLNLLVGDVRRPLAQAGRLAVFWQWRTDYYQAPEPEPSENLARAILETYSLSFASDRPDLVIIDRVAGHVLAIVEVKYLTGENASDRIRTAVHQIVRYARGYGDIGSIGPLLGRSLVVVSQGIDELSPPVPLPPGTPEVADFAAIRRKGLRAWAQQVHEARPA